MGELNNLTCCKNIVTWENPIAGVLKDVKRPYYMDYSRASIQQLDFLFTVVMNDPKA